MAALRSLKGSNGEYVEDSNSNQDKNGQGKKEKKGAFLSLYQKIIPRTL
jgi:hypothetical protein